MLTNLLISAAFAPPSGRTAIVGEAPQNLLERLWNALGLWPRVGLGVLGVGLVLAVLVWAIVKVGRGRWRAMLWGFTALCFASAVGLGYWALGFPEGRGASFVLWHQVVRVIVVLSAMAFVFGALALALPKTLDRLEGKSFVPFVAARHVRASKSGFLTLISVLSICGVAISSCALCLVVSVMGGFGADLKRKILGNNPHVRVEAVDGSAFGDYRDLLDEVRKIPGVRAATPVTGGEAMASSSSNTAGVQLRGIDPESVVKVIDLGYNIEVGRFEYLLDTKKLARLPPEEPIGLGPGGERYLKGPGLRALGGGKDDLDPEVEEAIVPDDVYPGIILGRELAKTLHVYVGDEITLVSPLGDLGPMGILPKSRKFRVAAVFYSGMYEYDASQAYVLLETAQEFLDLPGKITAIEARVENQRGSMLNLNLPARRQAQAVAEVNDGERVSEVRPLLERAIAERKDLRVRDWQEINRNLFSALKLEKIATFVILSLAILVASFCIICTLLLMVTEKSKEIAVLKALGASDRSVLAIFMTEGMMIGGIGTISGVATGLTTAVGLKWFGVRLDPEVYYIDRLPVSVDGVEYVLVALAAFVITSLATLYPALAASRLRPVDGIRYE